MQQSEKGMLWIIISVQKEDIMTCMLYVASTSCNQKRRMAYYYLLPLLW